MDNGSRRPRVLRRRCATGNRPGIEYAAWVRSADFPKVLTQLLALRSEPPLQGADNAFLEAMHTERSTLQAFYDAWLAAYRGDRDAWQENIRRVMRDDESNP